MHKTSPRAKAASLLMSAAMTSSLAMFAGGAAEAAPAPAAVTVRVADSASRPVASNEFGKIASHISGTFGKGGTVSGKFTPRKFKTNQSGTKLFAVGKLKATATRANGHVVGTDTKRVKLLVRKANGDPVSARAAAAPSCGILHLVLGPLHLDLLGLQVDLNKVVLDITAVPGAGNLLGNLLCAVAGLLDGTGASPLDSVSQILNSILAILQL
jgi:hypothetical protein